ncbi:hypothetical protein [Sphingomonas crusticola]|uniref:hypothetical protein n=1 Tax=Sphingomonas crusticola TaxID=1697973 RepID=UPI000E2727F4|nr:hypothetical protein [Sphingomonas crusticola]
MQLQETSELSYWLRREADERTQAASATDVPRQLHTQLADSYAALIGEWLGDAHFERAKQRSQDRQ